MRTIERFHIMVLILAAYVLKDVWNALPPHARVEIIHPFPFAPDQAIYPATHVWIASIYAFLVMLAFALGRMWRHWYFDVVFYLQLFELIEYFFNYNNPWSYCNLWGWWGFNIHITNLRFIILAICLIIIILTERRR